MSLSPFSQRGADHHTRAPGESRHPRMAHALTTMLSTRHSARGRERVAGLRSRRVPPAANASIRVSKPREIMPPIRTSSAPFAQFIALESSPAPTHAAIAECAYYKYLASGAHPGRCERNWLDAEIELSRRIEAPHIGPPIATSVTAHAAGGTLLKDLLVNSEMPFRAARRPGTD